VNAAQNWKLDMVCFQL